MCHSVWVDTEWEGGSVICRVGPKTNFPHMGAGKQNRVLNMQFLGLMFANVFPLRSKAVLCSSTVPTFIPGCGVAQRRN